MSTCEFIGNITAEVFLILKEKIKTRGILDGWNQIMAGFSNTIELPCPMCKKFEYWLPDVEQIKATVESKSNNGDKIHAE
jgi:hypothetical protein